MGSATLRPNGVVAPDAATVTPSGTAYDATNDTPDDDATYFSKPAGQSWTILDLGSTSLPSNSVVKLIEPLVRMQGDGATARGETQIRSGTTVLKTSAFSIGSSFEDFAVPSYANPALTQADIDSLRLAIRSTDGTVDVSEVDVVVIFAEQPTTNAIAPTGTETTSTPILEWQHTAGTDGGEQAAWQARVFNNTQYTAPNFDPATSYATWEDGDNTAVSSTTTGALAHDTDYRAYIRTAQRVGGQLHWADYDFVSFTVDLVGPAVDTLTVTVDNAFARNVADVTRDTGGDAWDYVELQHMAEANLIPDDASLFEGDVNTDGIADDWDADTTGTVGVTYSLTGGYQRMAVTGVSATEAVELQYGEPFPVSGGGDYVAGVTAKAPTLGADLAVTLGIRFFDALGNVEQTTESAFDDVTSADRGLLHAATAPDAAAYAAITVGVLGLTGASSAAVTADFVDAWVVAGAESAVWEDVAGATDVTPDTNDVSIIDAFAPGDTPTRYRARAVDTNGNTGDWVYAIGTYQWEQEDTWIKCPQRPGFSTAVCLAVRPSFKRKRRHGVHEILESASPRTVSGPRQLRTGQIEFETETEAEYQAVMAALEEPIVLLQFHPDYHIDQLWASLGDLDETFPDDKAMSLAWRSIVIDVVEVSGP